MDLLSTLTHTIRQLYSNLMPIPCLLCGAPHHEGCLCDACQAHLPLLGAACPRCASPLQQVMLCGQCLHSPPEQDASFSVFSYQSPIDHLIATLKYRDKLALIHLFATHMSHHLKHRVKPDALIPIPLHPHRLRERGFNQSLELAKQLSQQLAIPVRHDILIRVRDTPPQASLPFSERKKNINQAFQLKCTDVPAHIALIDDVLTTGHTANVAAKLLRQAGVKTIELWTIARTIKHSHSL